MNGFQQTQPLKNPLSVKAKAGALPMAYPGSSTLLSDKPLYHLAALRGMVPGRSWILISPCRKNPPNPKSSRSFPQRQKPKSELRV